MPSTIIERSTITDIRILPINSLWLVDTPPPSGWAVDDETPGLVSAQVLQLVTVEEESSLVIQPVTRRTSYSGQRQVASMLMATIYVAAGNQFATIEDLETYFLRKRISAILLLGQYIVIPGWIDKFLVLTQTDNEDNRPEVRYTVESVNAKRMRMKIEFSCRVRNLTPYLTESFPQYW